MMDNGNDILPEEFEKFYDQLKESAQSAGYLLNPDQETTRELVKGLMINARRYGYPACPCRLASGIKEEDVDIICPCDYREQDLNDYDACYCALYVSRAVAEGEKPVKPIPERRPPVGRRKTGKQGAQAMQLAALSYPVWRCRVCGYLCAREHPPEVCPVCKAGKERFEKFL